MKVPVDKETEIRLVSGVYMYRLKWKKDNSKSKVRKIHWTYNKFPSISWTRVIVARGGVCVVEVGGPVTGW